MSASTANDSESFAAVTQITQHSNLNAIWGNISDSTFDGTRYFGPLPSGPWNTTNDVYVYRGADCSQFPAGHSVNGPSNYYSRIPSDATHLLSAPLSGIGGITGKNERSRRVSDILQGHFKLRRLPRHLIRSSRDDRSIRQRGPTRCFRNAAGLMLKKRH